MGQKVNPIGFRLSIKNQTNSVWFENFKSYSLFIKEEVLICEYFTTQNLNINKIKFKRNLVNFFLIIYIYTLFPYLIEKKLYLQNISKKFLRLLKSKYIISINFIKILNPFTKANLLANAISQQIKNRVSFNRILQLFVLKKNLIKIFGIKIQISGRINGREKAKTEWYKKGCIPLQTLLANIEYSQKVVPTKYGSIGIKLWLFKKNS